MNIGVSTDSSYCFDGTDDRTSEDNCLVVDVDDSGQPVEQNDDALELGEFGVA